MQLLTLSPSNESWHISDDKVDEVAWWNRAACNYVD